MSGPVQPQVDVGVVTLQGFTNFSPILAALSADDVAPLAMVHMEGLGSYLPTSGPIAKRTPDLLQRCSSTRLDRLGLVLGWRKGDTASLMAQSAGGQAAALLSACLLAVYPQSYVGEILFDLVTRLHSSKMSILSPAQLSRASRSVSPKLGAIGFGGLLAQHFLKFSEIFEALGCKIPESFFNEISSESMVELLHGISRALKEENLVLRVHGSVGMSYITWFALTLFAHDTRVVVDGVITHEGLRKNILVEIDASEYNTSLPTMCLETVISSSVEHHLSIHLQNKSRFPQPPPFIWNGWVADYVTFELSRVAIPCPKKLLEACSDAVASIATDREATTLTNRKALPSDQKCNDGCDKDGYFSDSVARGFLMEDCGVCDTFAKLLKHRSQEEIKKTCSDLFQEAPAAILIHPLQALENLEETITHIPVNCSCHSGSTTSKFIDRWLIEGDLTTKPRDCDRALLTAIIRRAIMSGLMSLFIHADSNVAIITSPCEYRYKTPDFNVDHENFLRPVLNREGIRLSMIDCWIKSFIGNRRYHYPFLAQSSSFSTLIPSVAMNFQIPTNICFSFELVERCIILNDRYFERLAAYDQIPINADGNKGPETSQPANKKYSIIPSNYGQHENALFTLRERELFIELRITVQYAGETRDIDATSCVHGYHLLRQTQPCTHSRSSPLDLETWSQHVEETSIKRPYTHENAVGIVQTKGNELAQFLCCRNGVRMLLMRDCCLNCAVEQAFESKAPRRKPTFRAIIVT